MHPSSLGLFPCVVSPLAVETETATATRTPNSSRRLIGAQCNCENVEAGWSRPYMNMHWLPDPTDGGWFNIDEVLSGNVSSSQGINDAVEEKICMPYPPIG